MVALCHQLWVTPFIMPMSRRKKLLLLLVAVPFGLVLLLVVSVFLPAVQTWIAKRALTNQGTVERVAVGTGGVAIRGLTLEQPGVKIFMPDFRADLPVVSALGGRLDLRGLVASDVVIDYDPVEAARHAKENPPAAKPAKPASPFDGLLRMVSLPELQVNGLNVQGELRVSGPQPITAQFSVTGGGIAAGQAGKVEIKITAKADRTSDVFTTLALVPTLDATGQLSALALTLDATAKGFMLAAPATLCSEATITRQGTGEAWSFRVIAAEKALVELATTWAPGATNLPGRWKVNVTDADLAPFVAFFTLPKLAIGGEGTLAFLSTKGLQAAGKLDFSIDGLEVLGLPELGALKLASNFDFDVSAAEAKVRSFKLELGAGASPLLEVETKQAFAYAIPQRTVSSAQPEEELVAIRLIGVPSAWVSLFVPELTLAGPVTGAWSMRPDGDGVVLGSITPLLVSGVRYGPLGKPLVAFDALRLDGLQVRQNSAGFEATIKELQVVSKGADLLTAKLTAARKTGAPLSAHLELGAALASLVDQPALRGMTTLSAGRAFVVFDATMAPTNALEANGEVRLTGLRAGGPGDLPEVQIRPVLSRTAEGVATVRLPITVSASAPVRASDLDVSATLTPAATPGGDLTVLVKVLSQVLHVPDLQLFGGLVAKAPPAAAPAKTAPVDGPLWKGVKGEVSFALARIVLLPGVEVMNTVGALALTQEAVSLNKFGTLFNTGGDLALDGKLGWLSATRSYTLEGAVRGKDIQAGPLLKALNPTASVPLEGAYSLVGNLSGAGTDPAAVLARAAGEVRLTGQAGVLRAINLDSNRFARTGSAVAGLASLAGSLSGNPEIARQAARVSAANSVVRALSNLAYDELTLTARRGADGAVEIGELALRSPALNLSGSGSVGNLPDRSLWQQPLNLQLQLGAREALAGDLVTLGLAKPLASADAAAGAYAPLVENVVLDGTLAKVGTSSLMRLLERYVLGSR